MQNPTSVIQSSSQFAVGRYGRCKRCGYTPSTWENILQHLGFSHDQNWILFCPSGDIAETAKLRKFFFHRTRINDMVHAGRLKQLMEEAMRV